MTPDEVEILNVRERRERQLFAAIILQALEDATGAIVCDGGRHKNLIRRRARDWFIKGGKDFKEVCALAGMDPDWIRARALEKIEAAGDGMIRKRERKPTVMHNGERITIEELSARTGIPYKALYQRVKVGKTGAELIAPYRSQRVAMQITHDGVTHTTAEWSKITGVPLKTINFRIKAGWTIEEALTPARRLPTAKMTAHQKRAFNPFIRGALRPMCPNAPRSPTGPKGRLYTHAGKSLTLRQWSDTTGIPLSRLQARVYRMGWTLEKALTTPIIDPSKRRAGAEVVVKAPKPIAVKAPKTPRAPSGPKAKLHTFAGKSLTLAQWSAETGIPLTALYHRLGKMKWTLEQALTTSLIDAKATRQGRQPFKRYEHDGLSLTLAQWSERLGIKETTLWQRMHNGWSVERTLSTPTQHRKAA